MDDTTTTTVMVIAMVAVWLAVLSMVVLLLVRQVALLNVRIARGAGAAAARDGLMIGRPIPESVATQLPEVRLGVVYVLLMSAICAPCREVAPQLGRLRIDEPVVALVPGNGEAVRGLIEMLPSWFRVIADPAATQIAKELQIESTPFAFEVEFGIVTGKVFIHEASDLMHLVEARRSGERNLGGIPLEVASNVGSNTAS